MGDFVALCDTDDPNSKEYHMYHLAKVINVADGMAQLQNYAATNRKLANAKWKPLYQDTDGAYMLTKPRKEAETKRVVDAVETEEQDYVRHFGIKLTAAGKIVARHRKKLKQLGLRHHVLGVTFP